MENCQNFSKILWGCAVNGIDCLLRVSLYEAVEVVDFVIFSQPVVNFKSCLEKVFKQVKLLGFSVDRGHCCS